MRSEGRPISPFALEHYQLTQYRDAQAFLHILAALQGIVEFVPHQGDAYPAHQGQYQAYHQHARFVGFDRYEHRHRRIEHPGDHRHCIRAACAGFH